MLIDRNQLQLGDVLVQYQGQPWVWGAQTFTGHPYPHARCVSRVDSTGVWIIEDGKQLFTSQAGVHEYLLPNDLDSFEVWRPNTDSVTKTTAVIWMQGHKGQMYEPGLDEDQSFDNRPMICSELIAMGYYRAGRQTGTMYDPCPQVTDRSAGPWDLRNPITLTFIGNGVN
jgi:hypothetical protein